MRQRGSESEAESGVGPRGRQPGCTVGTDSMPSCRSMTSIPTGSGRFDDRVRAGCHLRRRQDPSSCGSMGRHTRKRVSPGSEETRMSP
ncbi:hypothetical protein ABID95_006703 [Streptomyces atratus]